MNLFKLDQKLAALLVEMEVKADAVPGLPPYVYPKTEKALKDAVEAFKKSLITKWSEDASI